MYDDSEKIVYNVTDGDMYKYSIIYIMCGNNE